MYRLSYLIPLVALLIAYYMGIDPYYSWAYLLLVGSALGTIAFMRYRFVNFNATEYLSGYVTKVEHLNAWVEKVVTEETKYDSEGKSYTVKKVEYRDHPDEWHWYLNTGYRQWISESLFLEMCGIWRTGVYTFETYHNNCVSGGGGERCYWNENEFDTCTVTYPHKYRNPVQSSQSLFKSSTISQNGNAQRIKLFDYPKISGFDQQVILCHPDLEKPESFEDANFALQHLNAFMGKQHEIHVFILLFKAEQDMKIAEMQRDYWRGLNKNEFVVCLGMDGKQVKWCQALSWMDVPTLSLKTRDYFIEHETLDLLAFVDWLRGNLDSWKRKEFKDFDYLPKKIPEEKIPIYWSVSVLMGIFVFIFCCAIGC